MKTEKINDGVITYTAIVPDEWDNPPNWHELRQAFANGYDSGEADACTPFECTISGDFSGNFILHCNGNGGTIEGDNPAVQVPKIDWAS